MKLTIKDTKVVNFREIQIGGVFLTPGEAMVWLKTSATRAYAVGNTSDGAFDGNEVVTPVRILSVEVERL